MSARNPLREWSHSVAEYLHTFPNDHPAQIGLRTYSLALSFSLGPVLVGFLARPRRKGVPRLLRALRRELGITGFAAAVTVAVAGGTALKSLLAHLEEKRSLVLPERIKAILSRLKDAHKTFLLNAFTAYIGILLLQHPQSRSSAALASKAGSSAFTSKKPSPTLDLTLLLLVRALDAIVRSAFLPPPTIQDVSSTEELKRAESRRRVLSARLDAMMFWASSSRYIVNLPIQ